MNDIKVPPKAGLFLCKGTKIEKPEQSKRFVIHRHTRAGETHWDLMIEWGDKLKTWRLDNPPEKLTAGKTKATPIFDHNKKFLTYQGSVNNGKGTVELVDEGSCIIESITENDIKIRFEGKILQGKFVQAGAYLQRY